MIFLSVTSRASGDVLHSTVSGSQDLAAPQLAWIVPGRVNYFTVNQR